MTWEGAPTVVWLMVSHLLPTALRILSGFYETTQVKEKVPVSLILMLGGFTELQQRGGSLQSEAGTTGTRPSPDLLAGLHLQASRPSQTCNYSSSRGSLRWWANFCKDSARKGEGVDWNSSFILSQLPVLGSIHCTRCTSWKKAPCQRQDLTATPAPWMFISGFWMVKLPVRETK